MRWQTFAREKEKEAVAQKTDTLLLKRCVCVGGFFGRLLMNMLL